MLYLQGSQRVNDGRAMQQIPGQQLSPCLVPLDCADGEMVHLCSYFFIFGCRIVHLKAITLNPLEGPWASPLLSVFIAGAGLCSPSGLGWHM